MRPWEYFQQYLHHGYYPFFLEGRNFTEQLLRSMNTMIEVDILFIKQIELKYLERIKKLLYLLAVSENTTPNVSRLAEEIGTSRATVMNYLKYLEEARLVNLVYKENEGFPKKPAAVLLHNPNLIYSIYSPSISEQNIMETYFVNSLWRHHTVSKGRRDGLYRINGNVEIHVCDRSKRVKSESQPSSSPATTPRWDAATTRFLFGSSASSIEPTAAFAPSRAECGTASALFTRNPDFVHCTKSGFLFSIMPFAPLACYIEGNVRKSV